MSSLHPPQNPLVQYSHKWRHCQLFLTNMNYKPFKTIQAQITHLTLIMVEKGLKDSSWRHCYNSPTLPTNSVVSSMIIMIIGIFTLAYHIPFIKIFFLFCKPDSFFPKDFLFFFLELSLTRQAIYCTLASLNLIVLKLVKLYTVCVRIAIRY